MGDKSDGRNDVLMENLEATKDLGKEGEGPPARKPTFKEKVMGPKPH